MMIMQSIGRWLTARTQREQVFILSGVAVVLLYLFWQLLLQPLMAARDLSSIRVVAAKQSLQRIQGMASQVLALQTDDSTAISSQSLVQRLNNTAQNHELNLVSLEPAADNRSVSLRLDSVGMPAVLAWLLDVERSQNMFVHSLMISPDGGDADSSEVSVSLRINQ